MGKKEVAEMFDAMDSTVDKLREVFVHVMEVWPLNYRDVAKHLNTSHATLQNFAKGKNVKRKVLIGIAEFVEPFMERERQFKAKEGELDNHFLRQARAEGKLRKDYSNFKLVPDESTLALAGF